ncbi:MAG TPA: hypothetical protein VG122_03480 [Gemmata sp.]|nr:hypothetical protein [Gemmata sp.]
MAETDRLWMFSNGIIPDEWNITVISDPETSCDRDYHGMREIEVVRQGELRTVIQEFDVCVRDNKPVYPYIGITAIVQIPAMM